MMITRIMRDRPGFEQRTFECSRCGEETVLMPSSSQLGRLSWLDLD
jgi:transcription elongation factor Elf1